MKWFLFICVSCFLLVSFSACGKTEKINDQSAAIEKESGEVVNEQEEKYGTSVVQNTEKESSIEKEEGSIEEEKNIENIESSTEENNTENMESSTEKVESDSQATENDIVVPADEDENTDAEPYVGEYNAYDIEEPGLEIQKNEDGTYIIQIEMYRLAQLYDCVGERTDQGISFSTTEWDGKDFSGIITFEGDDAIVRFTSSDWAEFTDINAVYKYYKISDIPNIYIPW